MNAFLEPAGSLPAAVYWRRRAIVLVLVILLVGGVWTLLSAFTSGGSTPAPNPTASSTAAATKPCIAKNISLRAETNQDSYATGEIPEFTMTITNTGDTTCSLEVGTDKQKYVVTSGSDMIWDSTVCQVDPQPYVQVFKPGQSETTNALQWGRTRSDDCTNGTPAIGGGASYQLTVFVGEIQSSENKQFMLY